jgi:hypothetical protein
VVSTSIGRGRDDVVLGRQARFLTHQEILNAQDLRQP